jgi:hypothetical protein
MSVILNRNPRLALRFADISAAGGRELRPGA